MKKFIVFDGDFLGWREKLEIKLNKLSEEYSDVKIEAMESYKNRDGSGIIVVIISYEEKQNKPNTMDHTSDASCYLCNSKAYTTDRCEYHANLNKFAGKELQIQELLRKSNAYLSLIRYRCNLNWGKGIPELSEMDELISSLRRELNY